MSKMSYTNNVIHDIGNFYIVNLNKLMKLTINNNDVYFFLFDFISLAFNCYLYFQHIVLDFNQLDL